MKSLKKVYLNLHFINLPLLQIGPLYGITLQDLTSFEFILDIFLRSQTRVIEISNFLKHGKIIDE